MKFYLIAAVFISLSVVNYTYGYPADHSNEDSNSSESHEHKHEFKSLEDIKKTREDCLKELSFSEDDKNLINSNKYDYPDTELVHKLIYCMGTKMNFFDDKNGYHLHHMIDNISKNNKIENKTELEEKVKKCLDKNEQKSTPEVWAYRNWKCLYDGHVFGDVHPVAATAK